MPNLNKDFYAYIPHWMETKLEKIIEKYQNEPWFEEHWNDFRAMCLALPIRNIPEPVIFFDGNETTPIEDKPARQEAEEKETEAEDEGVNFSEDDAGEILIGADDIQLPEQNDEELFAEEERSLELSDENDKKVSYTFIPENMPLGSDR